MLPVLAAAAGLAYLVAAARDDAEEDEQAQRRSERQQDDLLDECYILKGKCIKVQNSEGRELFRGTILRVDLSQEVVVLELISMSNRNQPKKMKVWSPRCGETVVRC